MEVDFYYFIIGLEVSIVILSLFGILALSWFELARNKWLILAFAGFVWPWSNLLIGADRFKLIEYSGFLDNPSFLIFLSPALYFYVNELIHPSSRRNVKVFFSFFLFFIVFYIFFVFNPLGDPYAFDQSENLFPLYVLMSGILITTVYFSVLTLKLVQFNQRKLKDEFADTNIFITLKWVKWLTWIILFMPVIGAVSTLSFIALKGNMPPELFTIISTLFAIGFLINFALRQPAIYQTANNLREEGTTEEGLPSYSNIDISEKAKVIYVGQIESFMNKEKPYLNPTIRMPDLANALNIPRHIFSYLINEHFQMNFFQFINQYRIEYAKALLVEGSHEKYTLEAISEMSGFNSKSTFNRRFKEITGVSPKEYQQANS